MRAIGTGNSDAGEMRPRAQLLPSAWVTYLSLTTPLFAVLYWLTIPNDGWRVVLAVHVAVTLVFALVAASVLRLSVRFDGTRVTARSLVGGTRVVDAADVARALLVDVYQPGALDTHPQLFLIGRDGRPLLRLRGQLWTETDMAALAASLNVPVERMPQPLDRSDLRRLHPGLLPWFER